MSDRAPKRTWPAAERENDSFVSRLHRPTLDKVRFGARQSKDGLNNATLRNLADYGNTRVAGAGLGGTAIAGMGTVVPCKLHYVNRWARKACCQAHP